MPKSKQTLPAVTSAARQVAPAHVTGLRNGTVTALSDATARVVTKLTETPSAHAVRLLSTNGGDFLLKHGRNTYQFEGGSLAVTTND